MDILKYPVFPVNYVRLFLQKHCSQLPHKIRHIIFLVLFIPVISIPAGAQHQHEFNFDVITSENSIPQKGLSANTVYSILQDSYGYMWFGTWDGLNKYDGYTFTTYDRKNGLSNETINAMVETEDGNIWIGTDDGLNCLNRHSEKVTVFRHDPPDSTTISGNRITCLFRDEPGRLLIGTDQGFCIFYIETLTAKRYPNRDFGLRNARSNQINHIMRASDGIYWTATNFGLLEYDPATRASIRHLNRPGYPGSLSDNRVRFVYEDKINRIWVGTENGLSLLNRQEQKFTVFKNNPSDPESISGNHIECMFEDSSGNFWIGTDGSGLNILDQENLTFGRVEAGSNQKVGAVNNRVYDIMEDLQGNVWIGTFSGVSIWDKFRPKFNLYTASQDDDESLVNNFVWAFLEYRPHIFWIATDAGIEVFNSNTRKFSPLSSFFTTENKLSSNRVRALLKDSFGNIWIGTRDAGLNKLETKTGKVFAFKPSIQYRNSICDNNILGLYQDDDGLIWVGTNNGLNTIDPVTHKIRVFKNDPDDPNSISSNTVYDFLKDHQGNLWVATLNGLNLFHPGSGTFSSYKNLWHDENKVITDRLFCLYEDRDNNLWLGTRGGGLELFDRQNHTFKSYTVEDGLPNNVVYKIIEDDNGHLWMSTNWGISMFDKKNESFVNFDVTDGLQSNEFNAGAGLKASDGKVFFGGMKGFNVFDPGQIKMNPKEPRIIITSFKKFNRPRPGQLLDGDTIVLSHNENFFSFEFSSLDYTSAFRSKYGYILENYNRDWTYVGGRRHFAEYTNVDPGTYTFRVIGSNNNGIWNAQGVSVTIIVTPPWHQTWYFRLLFTLTAIFIIWFLVNSRLRRIRRKHAMEKKVLKIEKQLFEIQQKALRLQMNPHFIFNSLNSIQSFILSRDIDLAVVYLSKFSQLMRLILSNSQESIIPLADEIDAVSHYIEIEKLRFDNKFDYRIEIDPEIDEEFTGVPPMIVQPYVENSIIHGLIHKTGHGHISIVFKRKEDFLLCTITDDGIGRQKAMEIKKQSGLDTKSRGMMITKERLDFLNRRGKERYNVKVTDLKDKKGNASGTKVEILIMWQDI
jgi:ligand-binding sensor domain-containing protein